VNHRTRAIWQVCGWAMLPTRLPPHQLHALHAALDAALTDAQPRHGWRGALTVAAVAAAATGPWRRWADLLLGTPCRPLRATLFDKPATANWWVPWHRDLVVPQQQRHDLPGWTAWSQKDGTWYAEPPVPWRSRRVALRIHLDACPHDAGPLRVRSGSHRHEANGDIALSMPRGAILAMHPLLEHASSPAAVPGRRILHVEYAPMAMPS